MTALALSHFPTPTLNLNWPRVSAWSGSLSLHLLIAFALLIPPTAMEIQRITKEDRTDVTIIEPDQKIAPEPALPQPPQRPRAAPKPPTPQITMTAPVPTPAPAPTMPAESITAPSPSENIAIAPSSGAGTADSAPTALAYGNQTRIKYPPEAFRKHEEGAVLLRVLVGADGVVQQIEIEKSSGSHSLDKAARDAVMHWTFKPGVRGGAAYAAWALVPVSFSLPQ